MDGKLLKAEKRIDWKSVAALKCNQLFDECGKKSFQKRKERVKEFERERRKEKEREGKKLKGFREKKERNNQTERKRK